MDINREEIIHLTHTYGGDWGLNHTQRLLQLVSIIGAGQLYDADAIWVAAHLHDWGAYAQWSQDGVDHALRSTQVAGDFLKERNYPADFVERVLECIEFHHSPSPNRCLEAILLCDADILDFLGVVGVLRDFSKNARDLHKAYDITKKRRATLPDTLILSQSKTIAAQRLQQMDELLANFERDSFGCF